MGDVMTDVSKHTPGPWHIEVVDDHGAGHSWPGRYSVYVDKPHVLTYGMDGEEGIYAENAADVALMNAAPDLRNAVECLRSAIEHIDVKLRNDVVIAGAHKELIAHCRAVIAQAVTATDPILAKIRP